jgi:tRNA-modifying protein YgfZ
MVDVCILPGRSVFRISGSDAREWLQGLITNDVEKIDETTGIFTALLSPQGKILFDFFVYGLNGDYLVDCEGTQEAAVVKRLSLYKMRSDVTLTSEPDIGVVSSCTALEDREGVVLQVRDPRLEKLGVRILGNAKAIEVAFKSQNIPIQDETAYRDYLLKLGVPNTSADLPDGKAYPLECNFEELNGVSFTKGCFIGQEVVARMKHKAVLKKRVLPFSTKMGPAPRGSIIQTGTTKVGEILASSGNQGLAMVRLKEWQEARASDLPLEANDVELDVRIPDWINRREGG